MGSATWPGGNGNYRLETYVSVSGRTIEQVVGIRKLAGTGFRTSDRQPWSVLIAGAPDEGSFTYDFRNYSYLEIARHSVGNVPYGQHSVSATVRMDFGSQYGGRQTLTVTDTVVIQDVPAAPTPLGLDQATISSIRFRFSGNSDGGSAILEWQAQIATDPNFTQNVQTVWSNGLTVFTGRPSGTTQYARARGRNGVGWSQYSALATGTTLPAGPPGMTVRPSPDGTYASIQLTPPGGAAGVTEYVVEYVPTGASLAIRVTSTVATLTVWGLTPGASYDWHAMARFPSTDTPWSTWQTIVQASPVADPNAYFDGSQGGRGNRIFAWTGPPHASPSLAEISTPVGWITTSASGTVALGRVAGGAFGSYAARSLVTASLTGPGLQLGLAATSLARSEVIPGAVYSGSIFARPSRAQRLVARVLWYNEAGGSLGSMDGGAIVVEAGEWKRLTVRGNAPLNAAFAVVRVVDVSGTGWSAWLVDQYLDADGAMISLRNLYDYFDGSFLGTSDSSFAWEDLPDASPSRRDLTPESLYVITDPDCIVVPSAPRPPQIVNDCVVTEGQWRRFWYSIPAAEVGEWTETLPTVRVRSAGADIGQVRIRFYRNPNSETSETLDSTSWDSELILSYVPPLATVTLDGISQRATAEVAGRTDVPADHLLYGSNGGVVSWPTLTCGDAYLMSWDIPPSIPAGNIAVELELTQRM